LSLSKGTFTLQETPSSLGAHRGRTAGFPAAPHGFLRQAQNRLRRTVFPHRALQTAPVCAKQGRFRKRFSRSAFAIPRSEGG